MCHRDGPVLALDTCGAEATLALAGFSAGQATLLREDRLRAKTAGSLLTGAMRDLLGELAPARLRAIVVVRGPGSFTGMRIGFSAAKALSEASAVPLIGVSRLAVLAQASSANYVALDAGRGSVYLAAFDETRSTGEPELLTAEEVRARLPEGPVICEDKLQPLFPQARRVAEPTAWEALLHARARMAAADWDDAATLEPLYLWRPEQMLRSGAGRL